METDLKNSVNAAVWKHVKAYWQKAMALDNAAVAWDVVSKIRAPLYSGTDASIIELRRLLRLHGDYSATNWNGAPPHVFMPLLAHCLHYMEDRVAQGDWKGVKLFSLLPMTDFTPKNFEFQQRLLWGLTARSKDTIGKAYIPQGAFFADPEQQWPNYFNMQAIAALKPGWQFAHSVTTDGYGASVLFHKDLTEEEKAAKDAAKGKGRKQKKKWQHQPAEGWQQKEWSKVWGLDPGFGHVFTACCVPRYSKQQGVKDTVERYSGEQYYHDAHINASMRRIRRWQADDTHYTAMIAKAPSPKSASPHNLLNYLLYWTYAPKIDLACFSRVDYMFHHMYTRDYRGQSFLRYIGRQKAIASMVKQLTKHAGAKTLVGFGDMGRSNGGCIKRCVRGPVQGLEHALRQVCTVVAIDEFRTSKEHAGSAASQGGGARPAVCPC
ncbi:hypothetical protein WJX73_000266 [Symbiochloris irregularis]|uniref:Uncharacterized protein n=1 Tax=Symbiochloris irregularis TaxID=706552 RepID=A0AAW1PGJ3_9CHLO